MAHRLTMSELDCRPENVFKIKQTTTTDIYKNIETNDQKNFTFPYIAEINNKINKFLISFDIQITEIQHKEHFNSFKPKVIICNIPSELS